MLANEHSHLTVAAQKSGSSRYVGLLEQHLLFESQGVASYLLRLVVV
jgi:hypothetical protein